MTVPYSESLAGRQRPAAPRRPRLAAWGLGLALVLGASATASAASALPQESVAIPGSLVLAGKDPIWKGYFDGAPFTGPLAVRHGIPYLPVLDLVRALGARVSVSSTAIALTTGDGTPPTPFLGTPGEVLLSQADLLGGLGPGYRRVVTAAPDLSPARAASGPDAPVAPLPGAARARIAQATLTAEPIARGVSPASVAPGSPTLLTETLAEYSGAAYASQAFEGVVARTAVGGAWPGVTAPPPLASLTPDLPPVGNQDQVWTGPTPLGPAVLTVVRVNNWVMTAVAVYPAGSPMPAEASLLGPVFAMQQNRIQALPTEGPPSPASSSPAGGSLPTPGAAAALKAAPSSHPLAVSLNGVFLGTASPTAEGEALPLSELAQALGVSAFRTGTRAVNLQSAADPDGGIIPPVILNPKDAVLPPSALGPFFAPSQTQSVPDSAIVNQDPGSQSAINDWGRLAGYSVLETQTSVPGHPDALPDPLAPAAVLLSATEYSTESGASAAIHVYSPSMAGAVKGKPLTLGDLNGPAGQGPVTAAVRVTGTGPNALRAIWLLTDVDNWEVEVAADGPAATFHLRNAWPVLSAEVAYIENGGHPG